MTTISNLANNPGNPGFFDVHISVKPTGKLRLKGTVAFFLHNSFPNEIRYICVVNGEANFAVLAYEAFTVGAYTEDGALLELDLQEKIGFPPEFYYKAATAKPKKKK